MPTERWWQSAAVLIIHLILFAFAFGIGFLIEAWLGERYENSHIAAFVPCIAATAFLTAFLVNRKRRDRAPLLIGLAGVPCLVFAIWYEGLYWNYAWARESKNQYLIHMFFGTERQCSATECVGELFFTSPCIAAIAYTLGAVIGFMMPARRSTSGG